MSLIEDLHPRRAGILEVLARVAREGREAPTEREIGRSVGLRSSQTVHHHLVALEEGGFIERGSAPSRKRRPLRLTERGWEAVGGAPLLGRVAAGRGLEAVAAGDDGHSLVAEFLGGRSGRRRFLLEARGDSMTGARIQEGDYLLVEEDEDPPDGAVVVVLLNGGEEATVKRLYREGSRVRLRPQSDGRHEEIVVPAAEVEVQGRVLWVFHPPAN